MNRPEENSIAKGLYMPDKCKIWEWGKIISVLPDDIQSEIKGFVLAHVGMAAKGREAQPSQGVASDIAREYANVQAR